MRFGRASGDLLEARRKPVTIDVLHIDDCRALRSRIGRGLWHYYAGIVLAGFVIGALGVLDDVTVTQVAAVSELHAAQPDLGAVQYRSAVIIGRDHISATVNTLFLAYAGAALPLLLLFTPAHQSVG